MATPQTPRNHITFVAVLSIATSITLSAVTFFGGSLYSVSAIQQEQERLLHRLPVEQGEPIVITGIRVNGHSISLDQRFAAGDDWMKGLVLTVKNRSDKRILFVSIGLRFPRPPSSQEQISISDIPYGNEELLARSPTPDERLVGIAPGQTADVQLTPQRFEDLRQFLAATGYPSITEKVNLKITEVIFEDDSMWSGGRHLRRDRKDSRAWTVAESPVAKTTVYLNSMARRSEDRIKTARRPTNPGLET